MFHASLTGCFSKNGVAVTSSGVRLIAKRFAVWMPVAGSVDGPIGYVGYWAVRQLALWNQNSSLFLR
jgi:hypothetical protein